MEFGYTEDLAGIDLSLPPDHPQTTLLFSRLNKPVAKPSIQVGCAKWGRKDWVGPFYPAGTRAQDYLSAYARLFHSVELNASFYKVPSAKVIQDWRQEVGKHFKFFPKFPRFITHIKRLKDTDAATDSFLESMRLFGEALGGCFIQLPPNFKPKDSERLLTFLRGLPADMKFSVEFRHAEWFEPSAAVEEVFSLMEGIGIGTVISDGAGRRDAVHMRLTQPRAFVRFVGNQLHPTDYSRLDAWVERIGTWLEHGLKELDFFMHQHEERHSPVLCAYFIRQLNARCGLHLAEPEFPE